MPIPDAVERGRQAFEQHRWPEAFDEFEHAATAAALEPIDLERLATAAYLTGHDTRSTDVWANAHASWLERGDASRAVRSAFWLGFGLIQRGDMAQGGGWLARAGRLMSEHELDTVEQGYLLVPTALVSLGAGEPDDALHHLDEVGAVARRFGDPDLATLAALGRGQALLGLGRQVEGLTHFDEAMVAVTTGETSPTVAGIVYCAVINECQRVFDFSRAHEWTAALDHWCAGQPGLVPYRGQCLVHRAQVETLHGEWDEAEVTAQSALSWLSDPPHPAVGMAHYQVAELLRLRGDSAAAEVSFRAAHAAGHDPQPGLALLRLDEGATDLAVASIDGALSAASDPASRVGLLPAYVEIMLASGQPEAAALGVEELETAADAGATMLVAIAAECRGELMVACGRPREALAPLHEAMLAWQRAGAPYETALRRVTIARALEDLGDHDSAEMERQAAREVFTALGAAAGIARLDRLAPGHGELVTPRELEVLRLVAAGRTNHEIGRTLSISDKTVERHLSNIFTKIGVGNRAAATSYAHDHGLL